MIKNPTLKRKYTAEFKADVLRLVTNGEPILNVARKMGISDSLIHAWRAAEKKKKGSSRLVITPDLKLFITTGDAGIPISAQYDTELTGKILRINLDGSVPADNPIVGNPVWSKGHWNPQGLVYANTKLYCSSHGAAIEDEINLIQKGRNYGWPGIEGPCDSQDEIISCEFNSVIEPIFSSGSAETWAFCGLDYYNNKAYPCWKDHLLLVSLKNQTLYSFKLSVDGNTIDGPPTLYFVGQFGRLRDIAIAPNGKVYLCTSNGENSDKIIEIIPGVE